jgi:hypothetical protein
MIKKRIKKIKKLMFLIIVRQSWKLLCNLYNIIGQPFLTFKKLIIKDRDKSQMFLVGIIFLMPTFAYTVTRLVWDYYQHGSILSGVGKVFLVAMSVQITLLIYLGYWLWRINKNK